MKKIRPLIAGSVFLLLGTVFLSGQTIRYGFQQDADNPTRITAVAVPDFTSDNVTISSAVFSFSLTSSVVVAPVIEPVPAAGSFTGHNGAWTAQKITPQIYANVGFDAADLQGNDLYQVVLQNAPELTSVEAGQGIPLFSFELVNDCAEGALEVLTNEGILKNAVYGSLHANFNNQMSMSVDDLPSVDIYDEKDPFTARIECPLLLNPNGDTPGPVGKVSIQPNPVLDVTTAVVYSPVAREGEFILYDARQREVWRSSRALIAGENTVSLDLTDLAAGTYLLLIELDDVTLPYKLVKIDY